MDRGYSIIGLGLLGGSALTGISSLYCSACKDFELSLSSEQLAKYRRVTKNRFMHYIIGLIIGMVLAVLYFYAMCYRTGQDLSYKHVSVILAILLGTQYLYYMLASKQYILPDLTNDQQREKYLAVHKTMMFRYHLGIVLGLIGCVVLCKSIKV